LGEPSDEWVETIKEVICRDLGLDYAWPGNVRELEQAVRRIMLSREYSGNLSRYAATGDLLSRLHYDLDTGRLDARRLLSGYCMMLYQKLGSFEEVARRTDLDRRTVKKYIQSFESPTE
jgi:transcriptional regulator of acetoin/glycerol metabolism